MSPPGQGPLRARASQVGKLQARVTTGRGREGEGKGREWWGGEGKGGHAVAAVDKVDAHPLLTPSLYGYRKIKNLRAVSQA